MHQRWQRGQRVSSPPPTCAQLLCTIFATSLCEESRDFRISRPHVRRIAQQNLTYCPQTCAEFRYLDPDQLLHPFRAIASAN
eukprot:4817788-Prymnesium_polylepis.1